MSSEQKRDEIWENIVAISDRTSRVVFADLLSRKCYATLIYSCLQHSDLLIRTSLTKAVLNYLKTTTNSATRLIAVPIDDPEQWQRYLLLSLKTNYFDLSAKILNKIYDSNHTKPKHPLINSDIAQLIYLSNDMPLINYFLTLPDAATWVKNFPISEITQDKKFLDHARHPRVNSKLFIKSRYPDSWLTAAIRSSNTQLVHLLLQYPKIKDALLNKNGDSDLPPLLLALRDADEKTIDYCLKAYHPTSKLNLYNKSLKPITAPGGETLLTYYLKVASAHGALIAVKTIAKVDPELIFQPNKINQTPLMLFFTDPNLISIFMHDTSVRSEYSEILHKYSHLFSKNINIADKNRHTIIYHALQLYGMRTTGIPVVQLLMSLGASLDYKSTSFMALNGHYDDFLITYLEKHNFYPPSEITLSLISANNMDLLSKLKPKSFYEPIPTDPLLHKLNTLLSKDNSKKTTVYFLVHQFLSKHNDNMLTMALRKTTLHREANSLQKLAAEHPLLITKRGAFGNSALQLALRKRANEKIILYILLNTSPNKISPDYLISDNGETPLTEIAKSGLKKKLRTMSINWTSILMQKSILYYLYINGFENPNKDPITEQNFTGLASAIRQIWSNESSGEDDPDILFWIQFRRLYLETISFKEYKLNISQITNSLPLSLAHKYFPELPPARQEALLHAIEHMIKKQYSIIRQNQLNVRKHINLFDNKGKTPLDHACEKQKWDIANIFICRFGSNKIGPGLIELMISQKTNLLKKILRSCDVTIKLPFDQEISNKIIIELLSNKQLPYIHWLITSRFISRPNSLGLAEIFPSFLHSAKLNNYNKLILWQKVDSYFGRLNLLALNNFYEQNESILIKQILMALKFTSMLDEKKFFLNWILNKFSFVITKNTELIYSIFRFGTVDLINKFFAVIPYKIASKKINSIAKDHRDFQKIHDHKLWLLTKSDKINLTQIYRSIAYRLHLADGSHMRYISWMKESLDTAIDSGNLELLKIILSEVIRIRSSLIMEHEKMDNFKSVFQPVLELQDDSAVITDAKQIISDRLNALENF